MKNASLSPLSARHAVPASWQNIAAELSKDEIILAHLELDLDPSLHFGSGIVILTNFRLLSRYQNALAWQTWTYRPDFVLRHQDHAGVGSLELHDAKERLGNWRYTLAHNPDALHLIAEFELLAKRIKSGTSTIIPEELEEDDGDVDEAEGNAAENQAPSPAALFRLWRFAKPYKGQLILGFLLTLASTAATLVPPYLTLPLMDNVLIPYQNGAPIDTPLVTLYLSGLLGSAVAAWLLGWARTYILALVSERIGADLRTTAYEHLLRLSLEYFGGKRTGDLMTRIGSETDRICVFLSLHLLDFLTDVLMILMTAAILVSINPWLALVTLLPLPFIAWMIHVVRDKLRNGFEKVDRIWSQVTNVLADTIPGIRVVKAFAQEKREAARFREANNHNLQINDRVNKVWSLFSPTVTFLTEIGLLVVWALGIWQVSRGLITVGVLTAFLAYISRFYTRLDSMSRIVSVTQKAATGAKRIFDILDHVSSVPEATNPVRLENVRGEITVNNIGFRYGNRAVIRGLDLTIKPGEMIGLVGHSGSGKSTLVNLICRFYDVSQGSIMVDGIDIRSIAIPEFRRNIGLVLQEPFLFFGTIADNIAYGKPDATREEIIAAARAANAHEFILRLPHGYDSMVGERGQTLSGGERQRISIARALLIDPHILILDEATSSVDTTTEREIQKALDNLVRGRTTIAIAHRLSTLRRADRIVVMDRGQIVEVGSHEALLESRGAYYKLYQAQARQAENDLLEDAALLNGESA
jgi:ATP-binding cassette subfamily B protein